MHNSLKQIDISDVYDFLHHCHYVVANRRRILSASSESIVLELSKVLFKKITTFSWLVNKNGKFGDWNKQETAPSVALEKSNIGSVY